MQLYINDQIHVKRQDKTPQICAYREQKDDSEEKGESYSHDN